MHQPEIAEELQGYFVKLPKIVSSLFLHDKEFTFFFGIARWSNTGLLDYGQ